MFIPLISFFDILNFVASDINKGGIKHKRQYHPATIAYGQNHVSNSLMCDSLQFAVICISILFKLKLKLKFGH